MRSTCKLPFALIYLFFGDSGKSDKCPDAKKGHGFVFFSLQPGSCFRSQSHCTLGASRQNTQGRRSRFFEATKRAAFFRPKNAGRSFCCLLAWEVDHAAPPSGCHAAEPTKKGKK
ncbi:hypothetical protein TW95_gp0116 [Pandoravirus inopinatum]|uniref:Uncharacterized protein n=1 Tax=Pandoravirus inopinatum TaxID=1605721 RepID=A0A0B5J5C9_9VIRU|nr:hypothetical protein TW95_gp0116 [Pandoravirus inopinatum]AJF96850.1 hypothetical protein [Pandoravirus inopinatum]